MHFSEPFSSVISTKAEKRNIKDNFNFSELRGRAGAMTYELLVNALLKTQ